jgi:hypothetical protein
MDTQGHAREHGPIDPRQGPDDATVPVGGLRSLELRWLARGPLPDDVLEWVGPFGEPSEGRDDRYLATASPDVGVKIRGGTQLDVKVFRGSPGDLAISDAIRGHLEFWERWSFPLGPSSLPSDDASAWLTIGKRRRRRSFRVSEGSVVERPLREAELPGCALEVTEVEVDDEAWWTLGLEARGDLGPLEPVLRLTASSLLRDPIPDGLHLGIADSASYAGWLGRRGPRRRPDDT